MTQRTVVMILMLGASVHAAEVFHRVCTGSLGSVTIPVYVQGKCVFQCVTPSGWQARPQPAGSPAVIFTSLTNPAAAITVAIAPVSLAEHELQPWRIPRLRESLRTRGTFTLMAESPTTVDESPGVQMRGVRRTAGQTREEFHSFHIRYGYLITISAQAPQLDQVLPAVRTVVVTFRSFQQLPSDASSVSARSEQ